MFFFFFLGFSLGNNTIANAPLNLSFGAATTTATTSASAFSLGNTLNPKTTAPLTGTQLNLGVTTNVTTSAASGKLKFSCVYYEYTEKAYHVFSLG